MKKQYHFNLDQFFLYNLSPNNDICADCNSQYPTYISINNSIFLCEKCALKHKQFGYNISYIRSIHEQFDDYLLNFIYRGGNKRYFQYCISTTLNAMQPELRYKSYGMEYYRVLVCIH